MNTQQGINEFTEAMNNVLDKHQKEKGDSWVDCDIDFLLFKLDEEIKEFKEANRPIAKAEELVDVANVCMMLYNRYIDEWSKKTNTIIAFDEGVI